VAKDKQNENKIYENCPHCGQKLSPWQQVLLNVDRALMCKNCWYRIFLDSRDESDEQSAKREES
jgi:DNA-directed RNA polymerase subunit RPC12/RpoP